MMDTELVAKELFIGRIDQQESDNRIVHLTEVWTTA
jgi:hypothetical protein